MTDKLKREVLESLEEEDLNGAVDQLKTGLRRDPYWEWGHRMLGDVYLEALGHSAYALVQYRKLREVKETLSGPEFLRLARAYEERGFEDKAVELLRELDPAELPEEVEILDASYDARDLYERLRSASADAVEEDAEGYREKYRRKGDDHREYGNFFEAQQAYEKALEFSDDPEVRLKLGQCLLQRSLYPEALDHLKQVRNDEEVGDEAERLIADVYDRLGLNQLFDDNDNDDDDRSGGHRKVS